MKHQLRAAGRKGLQAVVRCLSEFRERSSPSQYQSVVSSLKRYAPRQASTLFSAGPSRFGDLAWAAQRMSELPLEKELIWAKAWLNGQSIKINQFRRASSSVQELVLSAQHEEAARVLDSYIATAGWSLWAAQLRCAIQQAMAGTEAQKKWSASHQHAAPNSIPALLMHVFSERNEESFAYDGFYAKCMDSFPRYKSVGSWLPRYLLYYALNHYDEPKGTYSSVLSRDISSSFIDYYESCIDAVRTICNERSLRDLRPVALDLVESLTKDGVIDYRLKKLSVALSGNPQSEPAEQTVVEDETRKLFSLLQDPRSYSSAGYLKVIADHLTECELHGVAAGSAIAELLKIGINYRSIDAGLAIAMAAQDYASNLIDTRVCSLEVAMLVPEFTLIDIASIPDASGRELLKSTSVFSGQLRKQCNDIDGVLMGNPLSHSIARNDSITVWLGRQLIQADRLDEAYQLGEVLESGQGRWPRSGGKLKLWALIKQGKLEEALNYAATWILSGSHYVAELPVKEIFSGRDWPSFRDIDPVLVGLVAHHANTGQSQASVGYICKMACRRYAITGKRDELLTQLESMPGAARDRSLAIAFLRDVWIEENLSMNHLLESTDDVRMERMKVLQMLLQMDVENEADYIEEIKFITFDEKLRQGLRHINQTRIFVNESAITRWAEKELPLEFERWKSLRDSPGEAQISDELLRQYVVDPHNEDLLREIGGGRPTDADVVLTNLLERLYRRFLTDPADGLDCYLSLRIRHGSLRGTLFGPLEEQGLYCDPKGSNSAFESRWGGVLNLAQLERASVLELMRDFSGKISNISDDLVGQRVQIKSPDKPQGFISPYLSPTFAKLLANALIGQPVTFTSFVYSCYFVFWKLVEVGLQDLSSYVKNDVKKQIRKEFDELVVSLRQLGPKALPLVTALTTVATTTQSQCDVVADWFRLPGRSDDEKYKLSAAIEIARTSTRNVHRAFPAEIDIQSMPEEDLPLGTLALEVVSDCLFVIFENAWKHSGLGDDVGKLTLVANFDSAEKLLTITVNNHLSSSVLDSMQSGLLQKLRDRHLSSAPLEMASREGGSGFAKLARLSRYVDRAYCPSPLGFGVIEKKWFTTVTIPLFERDGAYEAFQ